MYIVRGKTGVQQAQPEQERLNLDADRHENNADGCNSHERDRHGCNGNAFFGNRHGVNRDAYVHDAREQDCNRDGHRGDVERNRSGHGHNRNKEKYARHCNRDMFSHDWDMHDLNRDRDGSNRHNSHGNCDCNGDRSPTHTNAAGTGTTTMWTSLPSMGAAATGMTTAATGMTTAAIRAAMETTRKENPQ